MAIVLFPRYNITIYIIKFISDVASFNRIDKIKHSLGLVAERFE